MRPRALIALLVAASLPAQQPAARPFDVEAALDITSYQVRDLSDDGRWLVATSQTRRDAIGIDYNRSFRNPTYIPPANQRLWLFDLQAASPQGRELLPGRHNVRGAAFSPDGRTLALILATGQGSALSLLDLASRRREAVRLPAGQYVAENSRLEWTRDGSLVFQLRTTTWRDSARAEFLRLTAGPVIVQNSTAPFLGWDALRRRNTVRAIVAYDLGTKRIRELLPERILANWTLAEDGSVLTYYDDITAKTDYDVIFGTENRLRVRSLASADTGRTVLPTLKGVTLVWSRDGKRLAYAQEGKLWLSTVMHTLKVQLAGDAGRVRPGAPRDTSPAARERQANERFTPLRMSPSGDAIVASNRRGLWLIDVATKGRELILETSDSLPDSPRASVVGFSPTGRHVYLTRVSRTEWQRGIARYDRDAKRLEELLTDDRLYANINIPREGGGIVFSAAPAIAR